MPSTMAQKPLPPAPEATDGTFRIFDHGDLDLSAAMVVTGFPTVGVVATIATSFLVQALKLQRIASIYSPGMPPLAAVHDGISMAPLRIHGGPMVCGVDGKCDQLAVVLAEISPPPESLFSLAEAILDWAHRRGAREVLALEGIKMEGDPGKEARVYGIGNSEATRKRLKGLKVPLQGEGFLGGFAAPLTFMGEAKGIPVTCLLAEARVDYPDARGAARLLETMKPMIPHITIDAEPLYRQAELIETQLKASLDRHRQVLDSMSEQSRIMYG